MNSLMNNDKVQMAMYAMFANAIENGNVEHFCGIGNERVKTRQIKKVKAKRKKQKKARRKNRKK